MNIIVDTREQQPLGFGIYDNVKVYKDTLPVGDYSLVGHDLPKDDLSVCIERKADTREFLTNIGAAWERFTRELEVLSTYKNKLILICGPNNCDKLYDCKWTKIHPNFLSKRIAEIYAIYQIPVIFFYSREAVEEYIFRLFKEILKFTYDNA